MSGQTFERRARTWLEAGPTDLPADAIANVMAAIDGVAQDRPPLRLFRSRSRVRWALVLAGLLALAGVAAWLVGSRLLTPPTRDPDDLLSGFPEATLMVERSGRTAEDEAVIELGGLPGDGAFVLAGSCTGGDGIIAEAFYPGEIRAGPSGGDIEGRAAVLSNLFFNCDGAVHHRYVGTQDLPAGAPSPVVLRVAPGVAWRFAIGEYQALAGRPLFPPANPRDGWYVVNEPLPNLVTSLMRFEVPSPSDADAIAVQVRCFGDPVSLSMSGAGEAITTPCDNLATAIRVEGPAIGATLMVEVVSEGVTWVQVAAEVNGDMTLTHATAPPMPAGLPDVGFAESDGQYLAFGHLGSNTQVTAYEPQSYPGAAGGDLVGVMSPDGSGGTSLDLWSIATGSRTQTLASIPAGDNTGPSWVDDVHRVVYFTVYRSDFSVEWHRIGIDGSGDHVIARAPDGVAVSDGLLAVDRSAFIAEWCPADGPCTRVVDDPATGETRRLELDGDRACVLVGAVAGTLVTFGGPSCEKGVRQDVFAEAYDGTARRDLVAGTVPGRVIQGSRGPSYLSWSPEDEQTTYRVVPLEGGTPRDILTVEHPGRFELAPPPVQLPVGDWIVIGGPLADTYVNQQNLGPVPRLLNVETGEVINLPNLPGLQP